MIPERTLIDYDYILSKDDHPPTNTKLIELGDFVMQNRNFLHKWAIALIDDQPLENTGLEVFILKLRTFADDFFDPNNIT